MRRAIEIPCERCGKPSVTLRGGFFCAECIAASTPVIPGGEVPDILDCADSTKLQAAKNRIEDDAKGINSVLRRNAVLMRALVLATQGDLEGYITEAERELDME